MSRESSDWLNTQTRIGFTEKRGNAWHYRKGATNHFPGAVPMDEVLDLFGFDVAPFDIAVIDGDEQRTIPGKKAWCRTDTMDTLGIFSDSYVGHQYKPWLLDSVESILSDDLAIGSAGLLRNGAQAWVQVEIPESITTPEGVEFRPNLMATTSFDGSLATTYKRTITVVVCDNTRSMALAEAGQQFKVKHSKNSAVKLNDARLALSVVHTMADDFAAEVADLTATTVTDHQWNQFLASLVPTTDDMAQLATTRANGKRTALTAMYKNDPRCAPWTGTAYGVVQTVNTWNLHSTSVKAGADRFQRIMEAAVSGRIGKSDATTLDLLQAVLV